MIDKESQLLAFNEDEFDLEAHKKAAGEQAKTIVQAQRARRRIAVYKIIIMLLAFVAAYWLYCLAGELIERYDYNKYHTTEYEDYME